MATRVFIPIPRSPLVDLQTGEIAPEWYLFLSRRLSSTTLLLDGADFGIDQNMLAVKSFQPHVPMPIMATNGDGIIAGQIFGG